MTTWAGHHHDFRTAPSFDLGTFALIAAGLLLSASVLGGGPATPGVTRAVGDEWVRPVATTRVIVSSPTTTPPAVAAPTAAPPAPAAAAAAPAPRVATTVATVATAPPPAFATGCADALAFLASHQAPGFADTCAPGSALGHYGYTCATVPGRCDGVRIIHIACPAPFVFMNEAHNSWTLIGQASGIDPYGQGSASEQAACDRYR